MVTQRGPERQRAVPSQVKGEEAARVVSGMARRCVSCFACWLLVLITVGTTGCATLVPFTHQMRVDNDLSADEVAQLQFYTSHDIALRREVTSKARRIDEGALQLRSGTRVERVLIPARTAGVVVAVDPDAIEVSFEPGTSIRFVVSGAERPMGVRPSSFAEPPPAPPLSPDARRIREAFGDLAGNYFLGEDDGRLSFGGYRWELEGGSTRAHLVVDASTLHEVEQQSTTLGGRRL